MVGELRLCPELYGLLVAPSACPSFCWPLAPHRTSLLLSCHLALCLRSTPAPSPKALEQKQKYLLMFAWLQLEHLMVAAKGLSFWSLRPTPKTSELD